MIRFSFAVMLIALLSACTQQSPNYSVAVVDLIKISEETGNSDMMNQELTKIRARLSTELQQVQSTLSQNIKLSQEKFGETPTDEQRQQLAQMLSEAQKKLQQAQGAAATELKNKQAELVAKLRDKIRPIAMDIAKQRGFSVILMQNDNVVLAVEQRTNITDDVIKLMKSQMPEKAAASETKPAENQPAETQK